MRIILALLYTTAMVPIGWTIPFGLSYGQTVTELDLFTDLVLFGMLPLGTLTLACYVLDHVLDWPHGILLATSACLSLAVLPLGYAYVLAKPKVLHDTWAITLEQEYEKSDADVITQPSPQVLTPVNKEVNEGDRGRQQDTGSVEGNLNQSTH